MVSIGPCIFRPHVDTCPNSALFQKPNLERIVNIRSRDHLVRFYNQIGKNFHNLALCWNQYPGMLILKWVVEEEMKR